MFIFCSCFPKYPYFNKPAFIPNPGPVHDIACISAPKHPDKSSSRLPAVETAHMRSAGVHADRCLCIFPLPILQRIPEHGNTALSFAVFIPHSFQSVFRPAFLLLSRFPPALPVFLSKSFSLLSLQAFPFSFSSFPSQDHKKASSGRSRRRLCDFYGFLDHAASGRSLLIIPFQPVLAVILPFSDRITSCRPCRGRLRALQERAP